MRTSDFLVEAQSLLRTLGPFDALFDNFLFRPWPGRIFARSSWTVVTNTLSVGLALSASALLMLEQRARRLGVWA
jgi:hypothetical protein